MKGKTATGNLAAVILAAGKGTRMNSDMAKVLHPLCGKPMLLFPLAAARALGAEKIVVVIGHQAQAVRNAVQDDKVFFALQREQLGTAHAVLQAKETLKDFHGTVLILCGDVPLLLPSTLKKLIDHHRNSSTLVTVLTTTPPDARGYGRVVQDGTGRILRIVEERDAGEGEKKITEINTGIYCVEADFLFAALSSIGTDNAQKEYYLTDIIEIAARQQRKARAFPLADYREAMGINTLGQLEEAHRIMEKRAGG